MFIEAEVVDNIAGAGGEAFDILGEVFGDMIGIAFEVVEGKTAGIMKCLAGDPVQDGFQVFNFAVPDLVIFL